MPVRPRLIGDTDRLILQGDQDRLLAFLDQAAKTGLPRPFCYANRDRYPSRQPWLDFWTTSRFVVRLLLLSGLRCAELAALCVRDCQIASPPHRLLVVGGKKRRADEVDEILISPDLARDLKAWIKAQRLAPDAPLIPNAHRREGGPCGRRWIWVLAKAPIRALGLNDKFATHHYRHRYATTLHQRSGGNLLLVQKQLRHKSLQPTGVYLHLADFESETMAAVRDITLDGPPTRRPAAPRSGQKAALLQASARPTKRR